MSSLTNALSGAWHCFFASMYGNLFQMDTRPQGEGGTSMFGSLGMYRFVWYRFMGSSILKKHSNSLFSVLNMVRIEGLKQHSPKQTFFTSPPPPPPPTPGEVSSHIHDDNSAKTPSPVFSELQCCF